MKKSIGPGPAQSAESSGESTPVVAAASGAGATRELQTAFDAVPSVPVLSSVTHKSTLQLGDVVSSSTCEPGADWREFSGYLRAKAQSGEVGDTWKKPLSQAVSVHFRPCEPEKVAQALDVLGESAALVARKQGKTAAEQDSAREQQAKHHPGTVVLVGYLDLPESLARAELVGRAYLKKDLPDSLPQVCVDQFEGIQGDPRSDPAAAAAIASYWMESDVVGDALHTTSPTGGAASSGPQLYLVASGVTAGPPDVLSWLSGLEFEGEHRKVKQGEPDMDMNSTEVDGNVLRGHWKAHLVERINVSGEGDAEVVDPNSQLRFIKSMSHHRSTISDDGLTAWLHKGNPADEWRMATLTCSAEPDTSKLQEGKAPAKVDFTSGRVLVDVTFASGNRGGARVHACVGVVSGDASSSSAPGDSKG